MKKISENNAKLGRKYVNILGINVISSSTSSVLAGVEEKISSSIKFSILTPTPELILASTKNKELKDALNSADFSIADGVGLNYGSKFLYGRSIQIIPGRILFGKLIELADKKGWRVFLLGGLNNEAALTAKILKANNPKLKIETSGESTVNINKFKPDLLFVAFGNPKQEIFTAKYLPKLNVGGMMAVGGAFRYIAGMSPLPPKWMEEFGLEWLWRLVTEPVRLARIWNAVVVFPWKVFIFKLSH